MHITNEESNMIHGAGYILLSHSHHINLPSFLIKKFDVFTNYGPHSAKHLVSCLTLSMCLILIDQSDLGTCLKLITCLSTLLNKVGLGLKVKYILSVFLSLGLFYL